MIYGNAEIGNLDIEFLFNISQLVKYDFFLFVFGKIWIMNKGGIG